MGSELGREARCGAEMPHRHGLLLLFWLCALGITLTCGNTLDNADVAVSSLPSEAGHPLEGLAGKTSFMQLAEKAKMAKDGCSGAYKKFKANIAKMTKLKAKATKKAAKAKKAQKKATMLLKRCNKNHSEILKKANWKKAVIKKKISIGAKKKYTKMKKKVDAKMKAKKKKMKVTISAAKKKEKKSTAKAKKWTKKEKATKRRLKAKYKSDLSKFKAVHKMRMKKKVKLEIQDGMVRKSREISKKQKAKYLKKLKAKMKEFDASLAKQKKKGFLAVEASKESAKEKVGKANKKVPPDTAAELADTKKKYKETLKKSDTCTRTLTKTRASLKDTKASLKAKLSKMKVKSEDCHFREKGLRKQKAKNETQMKGDEIKISDQKKLIQRLQAQLKLTRGKLSTAKQVIKGKNRQIMLLTRKTKGLSVRTASQKSKIKNIETKMSAGEGALMGEIERNKKTIRAEKEQGVVIGNQLRKSRLTNKKTERTLGRKVVKNRELGQQLYNTKRALDKWKSKYETLKQAHGTTVQRYRDTTSKLELCRDRIRDAKIKAQGCQEAMRRLKTYTGDQINQQRMTAERLRNKISMAEKKAHQLATSKEEKARANAMAKKAAGKAASKAVAAASAKAMAVKANAKDEVAKAAKEAVKAANAQAAKQAAKGAAAV